MFLQVSVCPQLGGCMVARGGGGMHGCSRGVCMVFSGGGHVWFFWGHAWFFLGDVHGFFWGACMVFSGGHAWFFPGGMHDFFWGACVVFSWGGVRSFSWLFLKTHNSYFIGLKPVFAKKFRDLFSTWGERYYYKLIRLNWPLENSENLEKLKILVWVKRTFGDFWSAIMFSVITKNHKNGCHWNKKLTPLCLGEPSS